MKFHTIFEKHPALCDLEKILGEGKTPIDVHGLPGSSIALLACTLFNAHRRAVLIVTGTMEEAENIHDDLESFQSLWTDPLEKRKKEGSESAGDSSPENNLPIYTFPQWETLPYEEKKVHFGITGQRIQALRALLEPPALIVTTAAALMCPTCPRDQFELSLISVQRGRNVDFEDFTRTLIQRGYERLNAVEHPGHIAIRGGIVDVFLHGAEQPHRIEFWGDDVQSIRIFNVETQRSIKEVEKVEILPPSEILLDFGLEDFSEKRLSDVEHRDGINLEEIRELLRDGIYREGLEQYLYLLYGENSSPVSYFPNDIIVILHHPGAVEAAFEQRFEEVENLFMSSGQEKKQPRPENFSVSPEEIHKGFMRYQAVRNNELRPQCSHVSFGGVSSRRYDNQLGALKEDLMELHQKGFVIYLVCNNEGQRERLTEILEEEYYTFNSAVLKIHEGFLFDTIRLAVLTDQDIFSRYHRHIRRKRYREGIVIPDYTTLRPGDYVVHVDCGIGRYMGLQRERLSGALTDCLVIAYADNDKLYVPVYQIKNIKRYNTEEGRVPVISKLGSGGWERLKVRTRKAIEDLTRDLLKLYAERKTLTGFSFSKDTLMQRELEASFIYEETPDQITALEEIKKDMESPNPMDRLICGDVGYGKTEVALRAACKVVMDSKQVAFLVPTTILAEQHYETFEERLADFPINVGVLSRFKTPSRQKDILERLREGKLDIVIGTHRLLSGDVVFKDLGLVIIDEEQRFGVKHKEKLKRMRRLVDIMALSATPIPRTMYFSIMGARDISIINTPPRDRLAVHTEVVPFDEDLIASAILREVDRGGQVYFVHNRVQSIYSMEERLKKLLPQIRFAVAHGQLPERQLEKVMIDFHHEAFDCLICSAIIENGLDIPSVNTIIINHADRFGLAEIYQLRGRVGRSNRRAFAYLIIPPEKGLTKKARSRLRAIEEFSELGSGFKIAMRDLEIRGAGDMLGARQHGFIEAVGFDLYCQLLKGAVDEIRGESRPSPVDTEIKLDENLYIPEKYIPDSTERLLFYRRLSAAENAREVDDIESEMRDRYGIFPQVTQNLIHSACLRVIAGKLGVKKLQLKDGFLRAVFDSSKKITRSDVAGFVQRAAKRLEFSNEPDGDGDGDCLVVCFAVAGKGPEGLIESINVLQTLLS